MKKVKFGALLLAGTMLLSMTGCGNQTAKSYVKHVKLGQYKGIEYTMDIAEVTDDDIQAKIDAFVDGVEKESVTGRAVKDGDIVNIDYTGTMDGVEFDGGSDEGHDLTIGSNSFIDGFEDGLIGHNIGETVSLDLTFPDEYPNDPDKAGKAVNFSVKINSISVTPELTDQLVKDNTDYDTIEAYKASIKEELEDQNKSTAESNAKQDVFEKVVANAEIDGYDEAEVKRLVDEQFTNFQQTAESYQSYGYGYEDVLSMYGYTSEEELKNGLTDYVKDYLDQKMVIYAVADAEGIKATSEETDAKVQEIMDMYQVETKEEVYDYFGEDYFEITVLSDKVMDFLMENAVQVESTEETTEAGDSEDTTEAETTEASTDDEATEAAADDEEAEASSEEENTEAASEEEAEDAASTEAE